MEQTITLRFTTETASAFKNALLQIACDLQSETKHAPDSFIAQSNTEHKLADMAMALQDAMFNAWLNDVAVNVKVPAPKQFEDDMVILERGTK